VCQELKAILKLNVPVGVNNPAMIVNPVSFDAGICNRWEMENLIYTGEAQRIKSQDVLLIWPGGVTEKRTVRVAETILTSRGVRDFSARMSPPDPSHSGKVSQSSSYHNLIDGLGAKNEFGESSRAILQAWKTPRT
jgi:hypothetical protein